MALGPEAITDFKGRFARQIAAEAQFALPQSTARAIAGPRST
jgi:hypothetical protein